MKPTMLATVLSMTALLTAACGGGGGEGDTGAQDIAADATADSPDPGSDPGTVDSGPGDPGPADPGGKPDTGAMDVSMDSAGDTTADVPAPICCFSDYGCPQGMECVPIEGEAGVCKPIPMAGDCWTGIDCGPGKVCLGAIPCRCGQVEPGDGCDIPGQCRDDTGGCCDSDADCPAHQVCAPGNTCQPEPAFGQCWTDDDCYDTQMCSGTGWCACGDLCGDGDVHPGQCDPLPQGCCNSDEDCDQGFVCRTLNPADHMPGSCVPSPLGPQCLGDAACCWDDTDCPGGYCGGAYSCGCIALCYVCGACAEPQMGLCASWGIQVNVTVGAAECGGMPEDHPAFSWYKVALSWKTSLPAKTQVEMALNAFTGQEGWIPLDEDWSLDHSLDVQFTHMHFPTVPKVGDTILIRVRAEGENGLKGLSDNIEIQVTQEIRDCMYPYDPACSDGEPVMCRALPPPCDADKVMAAFGGCQRCVFAATCTCDDGSVAICPSPIPKCKAGEVLAVQYSCHVCVSPFTCNPVI